MKQKPQPYDHPTIAAVGLGCARIGSIRGLGPKEAQALIDLAYERGVRLFDTANSYGQGDSEKIVGISLAGRQDVVIVTKLGKQVPRKARILKPVKTIMRGLVKLSSQTDRAVRKARGGVFPVCFDEPLLQHQLDQSRRRLRRDCLPVVMLHSATEQVLKAGNAIGFLEKAREAGALEQIGVSVDGLAAAEACLADSRIQMIQAPIAYGDEAMQNWSARAAASGRHVVAREVFRYADGSSPARTQNVIARLLQQAIGTPGVSTCLVGTINSIHLDQLLNVADACADASSRRNYEQ